MAKINILFDNTDYNIDESSLDSATNTLKSHLSNVMSGSGAVINLGGTLYNVDSTKLTTATNDFVSHLGKIAGSGAKVKVNGVEYSVDSTKLASATADIHAVLGNLSSNAGDNNQGSSILDGDGQEFYTLAPSILTFRSTEPLADFQEVKVNGQTVSASNYILEEGSTVVKLSIDYLKTLSDGNYDITVVSKNNAPSGKFTVTSPELNTCNFYYNQPYTAFVEYFGENESFFIRDDGTLDIIGHPSGMISKATWVFENNILTIESPIAGVLTGTISSDGLEIYCNELATSFSLNNEVIVADRNFLYCFNSEYNGYDVLAIDKNNILFNVIKTGINGYDTVGICGSAFDSCEMLAGIDIPEGILHIGRDAFISCVNLETVTFPSTLIAIEDEAFWNCSKLNNIVIPKNVTYIGYEAFWNCKALTNISFEGTVAQWNAMERDPFWNSNAPATEVVCSDGIVTL